MNDEEIKLELVNINSKLKGIESHLGDINGHLDKLNGQVDKNTIYRLRNEKMIDSLIEDRENKFKRYGDIFWKLGSVIVLILLGLQNLI